MGCTVYLEERVEGVTRGSGRGVGSGSKKTVKKVKGKDYELKHTVMVDSIKTRIKCIESDRSSMQDEIEKLLAKVYEYNNTIFILQDILKQGE